MLYQKKIADHFNLWQANYFVANDKLVAYPQAGEANKKSLRLELKDRILKCKLFLYKMNPLEWFNDFSNIQIDLNEFTPIKKSIKN